MRPSNRKAIVKMSVSTNIDDVFRDMDAFVAQAQQVAMPRALNKLRDQAQVAGLRKIADVYQIGPRTSEKYLRIKLAGASDLEAAMTMVGRRFPLSVMQPRQTRQGVTLSVKGRRVLIPHAFMSAALGGTHVFARGAYGGKSKGIRPTGQTFGRFVFGKGRLPISELYTFGPAETFANPDVEQAMHDRVEEQAAKVIGQEIRGALRGF